MAPLQQVNHLEADAQQYAITALAISSTVVGLGVVFLQYLLLSIRCFPSKLRPTTGELVCLVTAFWILHYIFDEILSTIVDGYINFVAPGDVVVMYGAFRGSNYNLHKAMAFGPGTLLVVEIATTCIVFLTLDFLLDTIIPLLNSPRDRRAIFYTLLRRFQARCNELTKFAHDFHMQEGMKLLVRRGWAGHKLLFMRKYSDVARFERRYIKAGGKKEERTLAWNFTVSQHALDEIMGILETIGSFGELGFHISGDKVSFQAMGVGSSINLVFELEDYALDGVHGEEHVKLA
jgi:hypothetical protein